MHTISSRLPAVAFAAWGIVLAAVAALALEVTPARADPPPYYPLGPQINVPESDLEGWTLCYQSSYASTFSDPANNLDAVLEECDGDYLLLAGKPVGSDTFDVLAAAPRADVLLDNAQSNTPTVANGTGWYFTADYSWGFAREGDVIIRNQCDIVDSPFGGGDVGGTGAYRLCWHLLQGAIDAGFRSGVADSLGGSHERFIYEAFDAPVCTLTCYVDAVNGDDNNGGTSPSDAFATIQKGVETVEDGGTVIVAAGTYGNVLIERPMTVTGPNAGTPGNGVRIDEAIIDGGFNDDVVMIHDANDVVFEGFFVQNGDSDCINVQDSRDITVRDNIVTSCTDDGIDFDDAGDDFGVYKGVISGNLIYGNNENSQSQIEVQESRYITISGNEVTGNSGDSPVFFLESSHIKFIRNLVHGNPCVSCAAAVNSIDLEDSLIAENEIDGTTEFSSGGDVVKFQGGSKNITIRNNILTSSGPDSQLIVINHNQDESDGPNRDIVITLNHLGDPNATGALEVHASAHSGDVEAERNWWGDPSGPNHNGGGPGTGAYIRDDDDNVDFTPWLCSGADLSPAIGFQPAYTIARAHYSPCDVTPPQWQVTFKEGFSNYTLDTWANSPVRMTFKCVDPGPLSTGIATTQGELSVIFPEGIYGEGNSPIPWSEGDLKGDADGELCIDRAGNVAEPIDPLPDASLVMVDTTSPVCEATESTIFLARRSTTGPIDLELQATDAFSGIDAAATSWSVRRTEGVAYRGPLSLLDDTPPDLVVRVPSVEMPNYSGAWLQVTVTIRDIAGNRDSCTFTIRTP